MELRAGFGADILAVFRAKTILLSCHPELPVRARPRALVAEGVRLGTLLR